MREAQEHDFPCTTDAVVPITASSSLPFDYITKGGPTRSLRQHPPSVCSSPSSSSDPGSPGSHQHWPTSVQALQLDKTVIPMDNPAPRTSKDALQGPILRSEVKDIYRYADEGRKVIIGPMPIRAFLDEFLSPAPSPTPKCSRVFNKIPLEPRDEGEIYNVLCSAINKGELCPSLNFCITAGLPDQHVPDIPQPEITAYDPSFGPTMEDDGTDGTATLELGHRPGLGPAELFVLVRKSGDPFCDSHSHDPHSKSIHKSFFAFENHRYQQHGDFDAGREEKRNLGHAVSYVSIACSRQHRTFYFSILIFGTRARLMRWDRAGGIVTAAFDYRRQPEPLCEFLWRFHHANSLQRGYDPTVIVASRAEEDLFRTCIRRHAAVQLGLSGAHHKELDEELRLHYESGKVVKMQVYDKCQYKMRSYLVCVPLASPRSAGGRSTRAYWAVEPTSSSQGKVHFVKDVWRIDIPGINEEGMTYVGMEEGGVENICDLEVFGDVPAYGLMTWSRKNKGDTKEGVRAEDQYVHPHQDFTCGSTGTAGNILSPEQGIETSTGTVQRTRTNDYISEPWVCNCLRDGLSLRVRKHVHCRVVLKQAGYTLRTFKGSRELFGGARDALKALDTAYRQCGRIHRDVSIDNIILYRDEVSRPRRGLLVDWEFSSVVDDTGKSTDGLHTGTWTFLSARILRYCNENYQTQEDDMESLFYVIMYCCLRWLPHRRDCELGYWLYDFFYEADEGENGRDCGGTEKHIQQGYGGVDFLRIFKFENGHIQQFFKTCYKLLATAHVVHREEGATLLWTMDRFQELCSSVFDSLSSDESTACDRTEHDASQCFFRRMRKCAAGTETCLIADAIFFHAEHGTAQVPNKRILEEAVDDADSPANQRERKRGRFEVPDRAVDPRRRTKRMTGGRHSYGMKSIRSENRIGRTYNLRRCPYLGSFTSFEGNRRSARLASSGPRTGLKWSSRS